MSRALIVFAKRPAPGAVKTRLTARITPDEAAALYAAFTEDSLDRFSRLDVDLRLYLSGDGGHGLSLPDGIDVFEQRGDGLGERMLRAFDETFAAGYRQAAIVGTDHPTLPDAFVELAFESLVEPCTVVIGPAEDGGYYLLGMNDLRPELFRGMEYGHPKVMEETLRRIERTPAALTILPYWYDVDRPQELCRLAAELADEGELAPRTRGIIGELAERYVWLRN